MSERPSAVDLLDQGTGLLKRTDRRELGLEQRAVDAVFRALPTPHLPRATRAR